MKRIRIQIDGAGFLTNDTLLMPEQTMVEIEPLSATITLKRPGFPNTVYDYINGQERIVIEVIEHTVS